MYWILMTLLNFITNWINCKDLTGVLYVSCIKDTNILAMWKYENTTVDHYRACKMMTGHLPRPLDGTIRPVIFLLQEALLFESCVAQQDNIRIKKCLSVIMLQFADSWITNDVLTWNRSGWKQYFWNMSVLRYDMISLSWLQMQYADKIVFNIWVIWINWFIQKCMVNANVTIFSPQSWHS